MQVEIPEGACHEGSDAGDRDGGNSGVVGSKHCGKRGGVSTCDGGNDNDGSCPPAAAADGINARGYLQYFV